MEIGTRLSELLKERGMTQRKLAKLLNLAPTTLSGYLKDKREPDYGMLTRFAEFFGVSADYLLGLTEVREDSVQALSVGEEKLLGIYRSLSAGEQDMLAEQAELFLQHRQKKEQVR